MFDAAFVWFLICFLQNPAPMTPAQVAAQMAVDAANNQKNRCKLTGGAKLLRIINFRQDLFCISYMFFCHIWDFFYALPLLPLGKVRYVYYSHNICKSLKLLMSKI